MRRRAARALGCCVVLTGLTAGLTACTDDAGSSSTPSPEPSSPPSTSSGPIDLSFGVYGSPEEVSVFEQMASHFDSINDRARVTVESWRNHDGLRNAVEAGEPLPDVFLVSRQDLRWYVENELTVPVDTLLDERGVDFGDVYARDALEAFSSDNRLQCMPYGVAPQVIFYNEDMVDFPRMAERGLDAPVNDAGEVDHRRWSWDQFQAAADFAARPRRSTKGVSIDPSLRGLAPFVYAGGGDLFDDDSDPTSLAFSDDATQSALETVLPLLRDPKVTLTQDELSEQDAAESFKAGDVAMIAGSRALVPELRDVPGLRFDVMPMPTIESQATVGDITGLCISQAAESPAVSADFLVYATSTDAVTEVASKGFLQPANQEVAYSDAFLQPGLEPLSSTVFNDSVSRMTIPPLIDSWAELDAAVAPYLEQMFYGSPILDLAALCEQIDLVSQPILNPEEPTESPSGSSSVSVSPNDASASP